MLCLTYLIVLITAVNLRRFAFLPTKNKYYYVLDVYLEMYFPRKKTNNNVRDKDAVTNTSVTRRIIISTVIIKYVNLSVTINWTEHMQCIYCIIYTCVYTVAVECKSKKRNVLNEWSNNWNNADAAGKGGLADLYNKYECNTFGNGWKQND